MMHIKQPSSDDLCFSPTYSLLCSVAIPVEQLWVKKSCRNQTGKTLFSCNSCCDETTTWKTKQRPAAPTQRFHAAAAHRPFSPLQRMLVHSAPTSGTLASSEVTSRSENNFPRPTKLSAPNTTLCIVVLPSKALMVSLSVPQSFVLLLYSQPCCTCITGPIIK